MLINACWRAFVSIEIVNSINSIGCDRVLLQKELTMGWFMIFGFRLCWVEHADLGLQIVSGGTG